jgi:hypothetical protein
MLAELVLLVLVHLTAQAAVVVVVGVLLVV